MKTNYKLALVILLVLTIVLWLSSLTVSAGMVWAG
jgi:hypothetical protein